MRSPARAYDAKITLLHVIDHGEDKAETEHYLKSSTERFDQPVEIVVCEGALVEKVVEFSGQYDLGPAPCQPISTSGFFSLCTTLIIA